MPVFENTSLVEWLRRVQLEWSLIPEQLASLTHVPDEVLQRYFRMSAEETLALPSIPEGLESAVPLISIYRRLKERFPETEDQVKWLFTENKDFDQLKPIDIMAQTKENLSWVSYYLESSAVNFR